MPYLLCFRSIAYAAESYHYRSSLLRAFLHYYIIIFAREIFADRTDGIYSDQAQNKDLIVTHFDILINQRKSKELNNDKNH